MSSQQSWITLLGEGSEAPGREPTACHTSSNRAITTSGGRTCVMNRRAVSRMKRVAAPGAPRGASGSDPMVSLPMSGRLDVLDRLRLEVLLRVGGVEHLAVEELLDAARGGLRDVLVGHAQLLRSGAPD